MNPYIPNRNDEKAEMLRSIGAEDISGLFSDIPQELLFNRRLNLPSPMSELEVRQTMKTLAKKNADPNELPCFLGAGAYDHYIPSVVKQLASRSEYYTAYTPYQPEISQGTLQAIFEYQSMICGLTGMEVSNASMYDGASSLAEAVMMAMDHTRKNKVLVSKTVHPEFRDVLKTYLKYHHVEPIEIEMTDGATDPDDLAAKIDASTACVVIQTPNFFGIVEDMAEIEKCTHAAKALLVTSVNPISLGILTPPSEYGADIVTGEGQSLGNDLNFGGPYLGFIAVNKALMRKMPGRICGFTHDIDGKRAFVLTLQAREQHIRREKATSNICSNQGLNALKATIYLATLGKAGIREIATQCAQKAHYAMEVLTASGRFKRAFDKPFFLEFALELGEQNPEAVNHNLLQNGIIGGLPLERYYPQYKNSVLLSFTEKRTREEILQLKNIMEEA